MVAWKTKTKYENMDVVLIISKDSEMVAIWKALFQQKNCQVITETVCKQCPANCELACS